MIKSVDYYVNMFRTDKSRAGQKVSIHYLRQTYQGRLKIKELYHEDPSSIRNAITHPRTIDCLNQVLKYGSHTRAITDIEYQKQKFFPLAVECPICDTPPDRLMWVQADLHWDCGMWDQPHSWVSICKQCKIAVGMYRLDDEPPEVEIETDGLVNQEQNSKYLHEENRKSWNAATKQHHSHKPDLIEQYKNGRNNLYPEDMAILGDVKGKSVVHLQCNDGQDTLSIAKYMGATVLGVDISDEAINFARKMSTEANIPGKFVRADIFDWCEENETLFDVVYTGYGAINWISDIKRWAQGIAKTLKPGGQFSMIEFHPLGLMLELDWTLKYDYMGGEHYTLGGVGDYVGNDHEGNFKNPHASHEFAWGIGDVVSALLEAGLKLNHLQEYPFVNGWQQFPDMRAGEGNRYYPPEDKPTLALMFSIVATKPE